MPILSHNKYGKSSYYDNLKVYEIKIINITNLRFDENIFLCLILTFSLNIFFSLSLSEYEKQIEIIDDINISISIILLLLIIMDWNIVIMSKKYLKNLDSFK
ncbi:hypothetical protein BCR32DRAFT_239771 [Anaeromyces robustus]|uniref:Uncharacterized protein n=1 Tax=Anaeromyces robustus TaxID=1754192 RepID=A0A1Y1XRC8_9FUNG|nr:hypothetical protein BCR32DRAFT_239771 [Anaeromyces robustus]|eukprot:ORX87864.1 hypothetical protein BCR32DRAFT_239771 [Anaeromyces robustus]